MSIFFINCLTNSSKTVCVCGGKREGVEREVDVNAYLDREEWHV